MSQEFKPKTIQDLIENWELLASNNLKDYQEFEKQGLDVHAQQAYGKMIGFRSAINHARILQANT